MQKIQFSNLILPTLNRNIPSFLQSNSPFFHLPFKSKMKSNFFQTISTNKIYTLPALSNTIRLYSLIPFNFLYSLNSLNSINYIQSKTQNSYISNWRSLRQFKLLSYSTSSDDDHIQKTLLIPNKAFYKFIEDSDPSSFSKQVTQLLERIKSLQENKQTNEDFLKDEDIEIQEIAKEELKQINDSLKILNDELCRCIILDNLKLDSEVKGIILEIKPGAGGDEAALFAGDLLEMYERLSRKYRWKWSVMHLSSGDKMDNSKSVKSVCVNIDGIDTWRILRHDSGVHRVQRVPKTETMGRVHTSTATVSIVPQMDMVDIKINPKDLRIDTFRAQGAGGQHVNTTDSAVRIVHLPTGIQAECQAERSQPRNKEMAMRTLISRLYDYELKLFNEKKKSFKAKLGSGDRSEKIRTYNVPQQRVTDHRIQESVIDLESFLLGEYHENWSQKLDEHEIQTVFNDNFPNDIIFDQIEKRRQKS